MTARCYLTAEGYLLEPKYVPTLASNAMNTGKSPAGLLNELTKQQKSLIVPNDRFLVLAGETDEIKGFRNGLAAAGVDSLRCTQIRGGGYDQLVPWCARVKVQHPDKSTSILTTVTLIAIGRESLFEAAMGSRNPKKPWDWFVVGLADVTFKLGSNFDDALRHAKESPVAN